METIIENQKREPVFITELQTLATLIDRIVEPNGNIIYATSEGMRDKELCVPIKSELEFEALIDNGVTCAPSDKSAIRNYFHVE